MYNRPIQIKTWLFWGIAALYFFYEFFIRVSPSIFIFDLASSFGIDPGRVGQLTAIYFFTFVVLQIPAGILIDRYGERFVLSSAALIFSIGDLLFAYSHTLAMAETSRFVMGIGASVSLVGTLKIITNYFPIQIRGLLIGLTGTVGVIGAVLGQNLLPWLSHYYNWRSQMFIYALIAMSFAVMMYLILPTHTRRTKRMLRINWRAVKKELRKPMVWLIALYAGLVNAPTVAFASMWGVPYLAKIDHISPYGAATIVSMVWLGQIVGSSVIGWLADRFNHRALMLFGGVGALFCMVMILFAHIQTITTLVTLMLGLGFFCSANYVAFASAAKFTNPSTNGLISGFINMFNMFMGTLLQLFIGWIISYIMHHHTYTLNLTTINLSLIGIPIFLLLSVFISMMVRLPHFITE